MIHENLKIIRLNVSVLRGASEKVFGMLHDKLIKRSRRCDEYCTRASATPPGPARPLPSGGNRSWISSHYARIQRTNIDSQFQSVCRDNSQDRKSTRLNSSHQIISY